MIKELQNNLAKAANTEKAVFLQRFFKAGKGEYAEGDVLIGVTVPATRKIVRQFHSMPLIEVQELLRSPIHEHRLAALFILVWQYEHSSAPVQKRIYQLYLRSTKYVNNWDLVDSSAPYIVGGYLLNQKDRSILDKLAMSGNLWKQRIALLATYQFIKQKQFNDTLRLAALLLHHKHDLIHKAIGWMLREVGNRDMTVEEKFLKSYYKTMPRTALRYAIEKFPYAKRQKYLKGEI